MMKRGEFLKLSCTGCLLGATGLLSVSSLLMSFSPKGHSSVYKAKVIDQKLTVPTEQLALKPLTIVRSSDLDYDIAVRQIEDGTYEALLLQCTHFSNPLIANGESYSCTLHGSEFDLHGQVRKGPASVPLTRLTCAVIDTNLIINVA